MVSQEAWVNAGKLTAGTKLLLENGQVGTLISVTTEELSQPQDTYNFTVEKQHDYFVGSSHVLVHNGPCSADNSAAEEVEGMEIHHLYPQQFREQFEKAGVDIDAEESQTILPQSLHTGAPDGVHAGPAADSWNGQWKQFFEQNENPTKPQVQDQLAKMRAATGI